jgi:hypothetical protein
MYGRDEFLQRGNFIVGDGMNTHFWKDPWLGNTMLANQYPSLYSLVCYKNVKVAEVMNQIPLNISFRRVVRDDRRKDWLYLVECLMEVHISNEPDRFKWHLPTSRDFSVNSL